MTKQMKILEKLAYFQKKADELFKLQSEYKAQAESFDKEYHQWMREELKLDANQLHPVHMQKAAIEATIDLTQG